MRYRNKGESGSPLICTKLKINLNRSHRPRREAKEKKYTAERFEGPIKVGRVIYTRLKGALKERLQYAEVVPELFTAICTGVEGGGPQ